jgi:hypothetical protein
MVQEKLKTIAQEMCIEKSREVELMKMVVDKIFNGEFATADYLKELITTLDLTTKEIVYMSYMFGVLSTKQNKEIVFLQWMLQDSKIAEKLWDDQW